MKINPITSNTAISGYRAGKVKKTADAPLRPAAAEVSFSSEGLAFAKVLADAKEKISAPDVLKDVSGLRAGIQSGSYEVSARDIAESIVSALR
jgi:anti-sigma28 factor (negative regulator of flagellin synthesis)